MNQKQLKKLQKNNKDKGVIVGPFVIFNYLLQRNFIIKMSKTIKENAFQTISNWASKYSKSSTTQGAKLSKLFTFKFINVNDKYRIDKIVSSDIPPLLARISSF